MSTGETCTSFIPNSERSGNDLQKCASNPSPTPCPHFLRGFCRYGDRCRYLHSSEGSNDTADIQKDCADVNHGTDSALAAPWADLQVDSTSWQETPPEQPQPTEVFPKNLRTQPCRYFSLGTCRRGDSCYYQHLSPTTNNSSKSPYDNHFQEIPNSNDRYAINAGDDPPPIGPSKEPCQFFLRGHCPRNGDCPFIHEDLEHHTQSTDDALSMPSLCRLYIQGKCARGTSCPFLHNEIVVEEDNQDTHVPTSPDICELHLLRRCTRGSACPFRHEHADAEVPLASDNISTVICQFFGRKGCPRGDVCPFLHDFSETSDPINPSSPNAYVTPVFDDGASRHFNAPSPSNTGNPGRCKFFDQGHCFRGSSCRYLHDLPDGNIETQASGYQPTKPCHFFQKGRCNNGDNCTYLHAITEEQPATGNGWEHTNWSSSDSQDGIINERPPKMKHNDVQAENPSQNSYQKSICKLYSQGYCKFGNSCRYLHSSAGDEGSSNPLKFRNKRICDFFAKGNCRKGTACSFAHETKDDQEVISSNWAPPTEMWIPTENSGQGEDKPSEVWNSWGYDEEQRPDWFDNQEGTENGEVSQDTVATGYIDTLPGIQLTEDDESRSRNEYVETETVVNGFNEDGDQPQPPNELTESVEKDINEDEMQPHPVSQIEVGADPHTDKESPDDEYQHMDSGIVDLTVEDSGDNIDTAHQTATAFSVPDAAHEIESYALPNDKSVDAETISRKSIVAETEILPNRMDTTVERNIFNSLITLGAGAGVQKVLTAFESHFVKLSNLPEDVKDVEVQELAEPFGEIVRMDLGRPTLMTVALIEYTNCASAVLAARTLDQTEYRSTTLIARLDLLGGSQNEKATDLSSHTVKLSWPTPSLTGWAYYSSISMAKEQANLLQGLTVGHRKIAVTYVSPRKKQTHSFTVELKNLPPHVTRDDLKALCPGTTSVNVAPQTNYDRDDTIRNVHNLLGPYEPVETFYVLPPDASAFRIIAFATFQNTEIAAQITTELHRSKHEFLKNNALSAEQVFTVMHFMPLPHFKVLKDDFYRLRDAHEKDCKIRILIKEENGQPVDPVHIHVDSTDPLAVGRARKALELLLCGETLLLEENTPWDNHFDTHEGRAFFTNLNHDARFFIKHSRRKRALQYFSRQLPMTDARELILRQLRYVRARSHKISLGKDAIRPLLSDRLRRLHDDDGIPAILNVVSRTLIVRSDRPNDIKKAKRVVAELTSSASASGTTISFRGPVSETQCSVCNCAVTKPINLPCGHVYCEMCLRHILCSSIGTNLPPLMCMVDREDDQIESSMPCYTEFPITVIVTLLSEREERKLFEFSLLSYVRQFPEEFHFCPTPGCPVFYRPDEPDYVLQCPTCRRRICPSCLIPFHEGLSCEQYQGA